jgi:hypothetical protein
MLQPNKATQARHADPGRHRARLRASVAGRSAKPGRSGPELGETTRVKSFERLAEAAPSRFPALRSCRPLLCNYRNKLCNDVLDEQLKFI